MLLGKSMEAGFGKANKLISLFGQALTLDAGSDSGNKQVVVIYPIL